MDTGFFAYSSQISSSGECIEEAIKKIEETDTNIKIKSWINLQVSGKLIISEVLNAIDHSDFFCADLTGLNDNVLFEIGYALAKDKPLFLINDTSHIESKRKFDELGLLSTIGYYPYTNTTQIVDGFFKERPFDPIDKYWKELLLKLPNTSDKKAILVLNSQTDSNFNLEIKNQIDYYKLPPVIDDANETLVQTITWYIQQLHSVPSVLVQFSSESRSGYEVHNAKCAFVAGMALGLGRKIQMIAEKPYHSPMDYRDLLKKFSNRSECQGIVGDFLKDVKQNIAKLLIDIEYSPNQKRRMNELHKINFGESIAEHESTKLYDYFVDTHHSEQLVKNEYNIIIGRKGTGKTATLYYLQEALAEDKRNNIILIKPINFEVDGLIELMEQSSGEFEKGFLIESIWKFLIYTEIANYMYHKIKNKPIYSLTEEDNKFIDFIEANDKIYLSDFSSRLEKQIDSLKNGELKSIENGSNNEFRLKVSELLQEKSILKMKKYFSEIITKDQKIVVLIDNLDKSWRKDSKINILSKYILGLLGVAGRVHSELSIIKSTNTKIDFHLTIFLRSDIYNHIVKFAREPDKIEVTRLNWDDEEKLFRIIEDRFTNLSLEKYKTEELWNKFFVDKVKGISTRSYIADSILPRPRDIIYFVKSCKDIAISRGHSTIKEEDVIKAHEEYSIWVFKTILVENGNSYSQMENFLYELMAENIILERNNIVQKMSNAGVRNIHGADVDNFIDHLVSLSVLGRETSDKHFAFDYDIETFKKNKMLANKLGSNRFRVHNALIPYLELKEN